MSKTAYRPSVKGSPSARFEVQKTKSGYIVSEAMGAVLTSHKAPGGRSEDSTAPIDLRVPAIYLNDATAKILLHSFVVVKDPLKHGRAKIALRRVGQDSYNHFALVLFLLGDPMRDGHGRAG